MTLAGPDVARICCAEDSWKNSVLTWTP